MSDAWPPALRPDPDALKRRAAVVQAAYVGDTEVVLAHLADSDDRVRSSVYVALHKLGRLDQAIIDSGTTDAAARVRKTLAELAATRTDIPISALLDDTNDAVCEMACWAAGEHGEDATWLVPQLSQIGTKHETPLCREAAIAALGAVGHPTGLPAILAGTKDRPNVRRRAVLALAPFEGAEVTAALDAALNDRDWQVRQAAEDLLEEPEA